MKPDKIQLSKVHVRAKNKSVCGISTDYLSLRVVSKLDFLCFTPTEEKCSSCLKQSFAIDSLD